jgi:hypothetical protein
VECVCSIVGYDVVGVAVIAQVAACFHPAGFVALLLLGVLAAYHGWAMISALMSIFGPQLGGAAKAGGADVEADDDASPGKVRLGGPSAAMRRHRQRQGTK